MSQLQGIAARLRALALDASPLSTNIASSERQLKSLSDQVRALGRSGVNTGQLLAAIRQAQTQAQKAADGAAHVKAEGVAWADHLARGGGSSQGGHPPPDRKPQPAGRSLDTPLLKVREAAAAGFSFIGDGDSEYLRNWSRKLQPDHSEHAVVIHGNPNVVAVKHQDGSRTVANPSELNAALPSDGKRLRLYSCSTGAKSDGFAQQLADSRGSEVIAPTHTVYALPDGGFEVGERDPVTNLMLVKGSWKVFSPKGNER